MIKGGYILQPRLFDESEASKMPPVARELWFYLLRKVNHADNGKFKRGSGFFTLKDIQDDLCWYSGYRKNTYSKSQISKSLRKLNEGNMAETVKATRGVVVTICNYDQYQDPKNYEGNAKDQRKKSTCYTINKNDKNDNKELHGGCPHSEIVNSYNSTLGHLLKNVKPSLWNGKRKISLKARWSEQKERQNIDWWNNYFNSVTSMPFLCGKNDSGWSADMEWLINQNNMAKVLEGKYLKTKNQPQKKRRVL